MGYPNLWGLLICTGEDCWAPVPLEGVAVSVAIRGFVAQVKATLRYRNVLKSPMEVMFKCPVDEGSAIYQVEAKINDRTIIGRCLEKKKAEAVYEEAVAAGRTALLVREDARTADIISLALGNMPPESTAEVTLSLVCDLTVASDGGVQFTLPTLLNPRYNPADGPTEDPHVSAGLGYVMTVTKPYAIEVTATVTGGQSIARVISHTDPINVAIEEDSRQAKITLDGGAFRTDHDWSFVVYYSNPYQPHALVETGDTTELGFMKDQVLMINMFPELPEGSYSHYNEVIFIIDRSGSMGGENIQNARAVLLLFLKSLPPGCRFNVISFGSNHTLLFPEGSQEYNEANLALALKLHETIDADMGGTEILQPLKTVYSKPADPEYSRQILLLTDGEVFNVDQVTELAERHAGNTRVFTVGIGDGASTALVKGLARAGGGRSELVTQRDRMQTKVMGLVSSMLQSSVRKVSVSCELDTPARLRLVPEVPPTIFAGQHLITYARMPPTAQLKSIKLTGTVDGQPWSASLNHEQVKIVHDASLALHRLAAKALIRHGYTDDSDEAKQEVVAMSTSSGVLSRYTALAAVDQDGKALHAVKKKRSYSADCPDMDNLEQMRWMSFPQDRDKLLKKKRKASRLSYAASSSINNICPQEENYSVSVEGLEGSECLDACDEDFQGLVMTPMIRCVKMPTSGGLVSRKMRDFFLKATSSSKVEETAREARNSDQQEGSQATEEVDKVDTFSELIKCQKFDGSWEKKDVSAIFSIDLKDFEIIDFEVPDEFVLATGLAIVILQEGFGDRKEEWQLLANKAKGFLHQKLGEANELKSPDTLGNVLNCLKLLLESLRAKYPNLVAIMTTK